ncbi:hypothetical protein ACRTDU_04470 [Sunxiuqinia elliptica]
MKALKIILVIATLVALIFVLFKEQIKSLFTSDSTKADTIFKQVSGSTPSSSPSREQIKSPVKDAGHISAVAVNNPMNIRAVAKNNWKGKITKDGEAFESFDRLVNGVRAGAKLVQNYFKLHGLKTIEKIIYRYAPPSENDTESYIQLAEDETGYKRDAELKPDKETIFALCKAMCKMENAYNLEKEVFDEAWELI